jgi:SAM-dependent methyltransferase
MRVIRKIRNVARMLRQKWASAASRKALWDREYATGKWDHCEHTPDAFIYEYVYRYCQNGSVLDLGCGSGNTGSELKTTGYGDYTGVDISEVALKRAAARSVASGREGTNRYVQGDIVAFVPTKKYDVILFRESLYYVPQVKMRSMLERYSRHLKEGGVFVVHVSGTKKRKSEKILKLIGARFSILERVSPNGSGDFILVFRDRPSWVGAVVPMAYWWDCVSFNVELDVLVGCVWRTQILG